MKRLGDPLRLFSDGSATRLVDSYLQLHAVGGLQPSLLFFARVARRCRPLVLLSPL